MPRERPAKKSQRQILFEEILEGKTEIERPWLGTLLSSFVAGMEVGFSVLVMAALTDALRAGHELALAAGYSVGFVFVVLGRSELFTEHTTLATLPVLARRASLGALARQWACVYIGNIGGAFAIAAMLAWVTPSLGLEPRIYAGFAQRLLHREATVVLGSAVLAGWLMGLLSWLVTASRETVSQIIIVVIIAGTIGLAHLPHCIVGSVEVLTGAFAIGHFDMEEYARFLLWSTLGNALGGVIFVALLKWAHARRTGAPPD